MYFAKHYQISNNHRLSIIRVDGEVELSIVYLNNPHPISARGVILYLNPLLWKIRQEHTYYDGPNCFYQFGPVEFLTCGMKAHCRKCQGEK